MKIAVISDIHAYPAALDVALKDAREQGAARFVCLGDIVGYGPSPVEAEALARASFDIVVAGNHDAAVAQQISDRDFNRRAQKAVDVHRAELDANALAWLAALPRYCEEGAVAYAHGTVCRIFGRTSAGFGYVFTPETADQAFAALPPKVRVLFVGHTHEACSWVKSEASALPVECPPKDFVLDLNARYIVNVGSVGYPRSTRESTYVLFDTETNHVQFRRLHFDFADYHRQLTAHGINIPLWLEDHLARQGMAC